MLIDSIRRSRGGAARRRILAALSGAAALLAALVLVAAQTPAASAQTPGNFNSPPDNYGGAMNYGTYIETYGTASGYGAVPYGNYIAAAGRMGSTFSGTPLMVGNTYAFTAASASYGTSAHYSGGVGMVYTFCTVRGGGGPVWLPGMEQGMSNGALLC